jgi:hypothetical protein
MTTPIQLIPEHSSHELIAVLKGLLTDAEHGAISGLVFGAAFRNQQFNCNSAGSMHGSPMVAIAVSNLITAEMLHKVGRKPLDTLF